MTTGPQNAVPFGQWLLLKRVAVGGMAELYLAKDTKTDRMVVIKRILPYLAEEAEFVRMFLDEARIAASLHHPNIAEVYELGFLEGSTFIAMEWVDGIDLRKVFAKEQARGGVVPPGIAAWLIARLAEGLNYAHARTDDYGLPLGIIHRDVSPQNVMVTFKGDVKLVDFGIAKATAWMSRSKPGVIKGKFLYLAPEQLTQDKLDHRADLFAVGTLLYELTTGKSPFARTSTEAIIYAIRMEEAEPASQVRPGYPQGLSRVIMKTLQKDRARRYQTGDELKAALEDFMRVEAPTTRADVIRYVSSLFGNDDERTSIFIPHNAQTPAATTDESATNLGTVPGPFDGLSGEHTVPIESVKVKLAEGRKPTGQQPAAPRPVPQVGTPRDNATTALLDDPALALAAKSDDDDTAVSRSGANALKVGQVLDALVPTDVGPVLKSVGPAAAPPRKRPPPPVPEPSSSDLPEVISVISVVSEIGEPASELPELRRPPPPVMGRPVSRPQPAPTRLPPPVPPAPPPPPAEKRAQRKTPGPVPNRRAPDADDLIATVETHDPEVSVSVTHSENRGRRVLFAILSVSVVLMLVLLTVLLWPSAESKHPKSTPPRVVEQPVVTPEPPANPPVATVQVTLKEGKRVGLVRVDGAASADSFQHAVGPLKVSWRCAPAKKKAHPVDHAVAFEVTAAGPNDFELTCQ